MNLFSRRCWTSACLSWAFAIATTTSPATAGEPPAVTFTVTVNRGADVGQGFGSLFEAASEDGTLVVGAGFQDGYNTQLRADRHALRFFVRPTDGNRSFHVEELPRPNDLTGTYLSGRDEVVRSTHGGLKAWAGQRFPSRHCPRSTGPVLCQIARVPRVRRSGGADPPAGDRT